MPSSVVITRSTPIVRTPRVMQLEGFFDVPPESHSTQEWTVSLPLEEREWSIGLIVGPSGAGKSTVARELFGEHLCAGYDWPHDKSVVDAFPIGLSIKEVTLLLSSVGFSSPPAWLRPFHVLSTGEQFRVTMARTLAERRDLAVVDEFTSVVDRTVAQIGSAAIARTVRQRGQKLIAVTCHYDVEEWLQPDWVYQPHLNLFQWRELQRRPPVTLRVARCGHSVWDVFRHHHYLDTSLNKSALCFVGFVGEIPVTFVAALGFPHAIRPGWRLHRLVCVPDFQGIGLGSVTAEYVASALKATGKPVFRVAGHPAVIAHCSRSPLWKMNRKPSMTQPVGRTSTVKEFARTAAVARLTAGFEYVGPALAKDIAGPLLRKTL